MTDDATGTLRERIAVVEAHQRHLEKKIDHMAEQLTDVHEVLLKARGAQWLLISMAMFLGFLTANLRNVISFFGWKL